MTYNVFGGTLNPTLHSIFTKGPELAHLAFSHPTWSIPVTPWWLEC